MNAIISVSDKTQIESLANSFSNSQINMISTGGTICRASDALRRQGAVEVHAACTHGLFTGGALSRLANHVDGVYTTDSLPNPRASVAAAPALARGLSKMMGRAPDNG